MDGNGQHASHRVQWLSWPWSVRKLRDFLARAIYERAVSEAMTMRIPRSPQAALGSVLCLVSFVAGTAAATRAQAKSGEGQQVAQVIEKALQQHGSEIH